MINVNINPDLFTIGNLHIRYYGIIYMLGFIITFLYLNNKIKKGKLELSKDKLYDLIFYSVIGVILGARIFEVLFWNPGYYFKNPLEILAVWNGGLSFHGGLVGAFILVYLFCKKNNISFLKIADLIVIPGTLAMVLGRIGNFLNSELYGTITNLSWCVNFANVEGCRHPYQIYSSLAHLLSFFILLIIGKKEHKQGYLFLLGILIFGIVRFSLDFFREDLRWFSLSLGQYLSIPLILFTSYILFKFYKEKKL